MHSLVTGSEKYILMLGFCRVTTVVALTPLRVLQAGVEPVCRAMT